MLDQPDMPEWAREAYAKHGPRIDSLFHNQKRETALIAVAEAASEARSFVWGDGCVVPEDIHTRKGMEWYVRQSHAARDKLDEALARLEAAK